MRTTILTLLFAGCGDASFSAGEVTVNGETVYESTSHKVESYIEDQFEELTGADIGEIDCPEMEATGAYTCDAEADGVSFAYAVSIDEEQDTFDYATPGYVFRDAVEQVMEDGIQQRFGVAIASECEAPIVMPSEPGTTFDCEAVASESGDRKTLRVRVTNEQGSVTWEEV